MFWTASLPVAGLRNLHRDAGGFAAVPWNLLCYSIPGVIIGGQIGPRLQGAVSQRTMEHAIGILFLVLAFGMFSVAMKKLTGG